jgi:plastocyanin
MVRRIEVTVLLLATMMLAACSGGQAAASKPAASAQNVTVKSTDQMRFEPANLTVRANTPVTLTLDNSGSALLHDLTIDDIGGQRVHILAQANGRGTGQFTAPAGVYQFYCSQPGHKDAGMVGTLTVS